LKSVPPKGGLRAGARPGNKDLPGKNHEAASISWTRRANKMRNAECRILSARILDMIPNSEIRIPNLPCSISPPHPAEASQSLREKGQPGRCFLPGSSLPPGYNPSTLEMSIRHRRTPGTAGVLPN
jgi:hypothetical protein